MSTARPRLLVCDDAPGFRLLVHTVFEDGGFAVAGYAEDWPTAERLAAELAPDAILLDLWLPIFERDGVARVRAACPGAVLAVISSLAVPEVAALVSGVEGIDIVLSKRAPPESLVAAMRAHMG